LRVSYRTGAANERYRPDLEPSGVACDPEAARKVLQR
jgi:hypothetical protein